MAVLRSDLADVETISIYSINSMESPTGGNLALPGTVGDSDQGLAGTHDPGLEHADENIGLKENGVTPYLSQNKLNLIPMDKSPLRPLKV